MNITVTDSNNVQNENLSPEVLVLFKSKVDSKCEDQIAQALSQSSGNLYQLALGSVTENVVGKCDGSFFQVTQMSSRVSPYTPPSSLLETKFESTDFTSNHNVAVLVEPAAGLTRWHRLKSRQNRANYLKAGMYAGFAFLTISSSVVSVVLGLGITSGPTKELATLGYRSAQLAWNCLTNEKEYTLEEQEAVDTLFALVNEVLATLVHEDNPWNTQTLRTRSQDAKKELQKKKILDNAREILRNSRNAKGARSRREAGLYDYYKFCTLLVIDENGQGRALVAQLLMEFLESMWERPMRQEQTVDKKVREVILFHIARIWIEQIKIKSDTFSKAYLHDTTKLLSTIVDENVTQAALIRLTMWACMQTIEPDMLTSIYAWARYHFALYRNLQKKNRTENGDVSTTPAFAHIRPHADQIISITNGWKKPFLGSTCNECHKKDDFKNIIKSYRAFISPTATSHPKVPTAFVALILEPCLAHVKIRDSECCQLERWAYDPGEESTQCAVAPSKSQMILATTKEWEVCNICVRAHNKGGAYLAAKGCRMLAQGSTVEYNSKHTIGCALFALDHRVDNGINFEIAYLLPLGHKTFPHRTSLHLFGRSSKRKAVNSKSESIRTYPTILEALRSACTKNYRAVEYWEITEEIEVPLELMIQGLLVLEAILPLRINEFKRIQSVLGGVISVSACLTILQLAIAMKETVGNTQTLWAVINSIAAAISVYRLMCYYVRKGCLALGQELLAIPNLLQKKTVSSPPCGCFFPDLSRTAPNSLREFASIQHHGGCDFLEPLAADFNISFLPSHRCVAKRSGFVQIDQAQQS